jgi:hypothetical protein
LSKRLTFLVSSAAATLPPFGLIEPFGILHGSQSAPLSFSLPTVNCFGRREGTKERNVTRSSKESHEILQKIGRVRVDLNSENREGSVAIGPEAIRGRLRELENSLILVQIKGENWTKYGSNLSNHFSYIVTDITSARPTISPATRMRSREAAAADKTSTTALWAMRLNDQYFR